MPTVGLLARCVVGDLGIVAGRWSLLRGAPCSREGGGGYVRDTEEAGRVGPQVEGYRVWLTGQGYTPGTVRNMLQELGQLGRWLSAEGLEPGQLDEERTEAFRAAQGTAGRRRVPGPRAMVPLLGFLRECGIAAAPRLRRRRSSCCSSSTGRGWSTSGTWLPPRCCAMRTPHAASWLSRQPTVEYSPRRP